MAPDVKLTVDHVVPVALGGSDDPTNLVTACDPCNAGKSSIAPGSDLVEDVARDALRWARAVQQAAALRLSEREVIDAQLEQFISAWNGWTYDERISVPMPPPEPTGDVLRDNWLDLIDHYMSRYTTPVDFTDGVLRIKVREGYGREAQGALRTKTVRARLAALLSAEVERVQIVPGWDGPIERPPTHTFRIEKRSFPIDENWRHSVERFLARGLPLDEILRLIEVTMQRRNVPDRDLFRFFAGCCWRAITDLEEDARRIIESEKQG